MGFWSFAPAFPGVVSGSVLHLLQPMAGRVWEQAEGLASFAAPRSQANAALSTAPPLPNSVRRLPGVRTEPRKEALGAFWDCQV